MVNVNNELVSYQKIKLSLEIFKNYLQFVPVKQYGQNLVHSSGIVLVVNPVTENLSDSRFLVLTNMTLPCEYCMMHAITVPDIQSPKVSNMPLMTPIAYSTAKLMLVDIVNISYTHPPMWPKQKEIQNSGLLQHFCHPKHLFPKKYYLFIFMKNYTIFLTFW